MDFEQELAEVLEANGADVVYLVVCLSAKRLSEVLNFAKFGEDFEIEILDESIQLLPQVTDFVVQELNFRRSKVDPFDS